MSEAVNVGDIESVLKLRDEFSHVAKNIITSVLPEMSGGMLAAGTAIVAVGYAFVTLANEARETAVQIEDMHNVTQAAIPALSDLKFAVESAGGTLEGMNSAMFMLGQRMENSGDKVDKGLQAIGLSLSELDAMQPDQRIIAISNAFQQAGENTNVAAAGFDIFGRRAKEILPVIMKPLGELADKSRELALTMSTEDVKAAEEFEISLNTLKATTSATWTQLGLHVSIAQEFTYGYERMKLAVANVALTFVDLADVMNADNVATTMFVTGLPPVTTALKGLADGSGLAAKGLHDYYEAAKQVNGIAAVSKMNLDDAKYSWHELEAVTREQTRAAKEYEQEQKALDREWEQGRQHLEKMIEKLNELMFKDLATYLHRTELRAEALVEALDEMGTGIHSVYLETVNLEETFTVTAEGPLEDMVNKTRALSVEVSKPSFHDGLKGLSQDFAQLGQIAGGSLDAVTRGIGLLIKSIDMMSSDDGGALGGLKKLGDEFKSLTKMEQAATIALVGLSIAAASVDSNTKAGQVLGMASKGAQIGSMFGPLGTLAGAGIGALVGALKVSPEELDARKAYESWQAKIVADFEKTATAEEKSVAAGRTWAKVNIDVSKAYIAIGLTGEQAMHDISIALDATHHSAEEVNDALARINDNLDAAKQDQDDLNTAIQEYGFTIDQLGPSMQKQQLTEQAMKLLNQWRLLVGSGIDMGLVTEKMSSNLNDYLHLAMKTGQQVPIEMKPIIQQLITQGLLTDENGDKITDLAKSGLSFSETMTQGFDRVVAALNKLLVGLGLIPAAAEDAANAIFRIPSLPDVPMPFQPQTEIPIYGPEVFVPSPRLAMVGTNGGEVVLHKDTYDRLQAGGSGGAAGMIHLEPHFHGVLVDGPSARKALDDYVWSEFPDALLRDVGGMRRAGKRAFK